MAAGLGNIAAAIAGDHRRNLDPILLEFDGIGDDMFGDIVDGHWFLRGACCIDDVFVVRRVGKGALAPCPPHQILRETLVGTPSDAFASDSFAHPTDRYSFSSIRACSRLRREYLPLSRSAGCSSRGVFASISISTASFGARSRLTPPRCISFSAVRIALSRSVAHAPVTAGPVRRRPRPR